ncbi:mitochondrial amidoxime-reducing component 1-like [Bradysia coprophila]|uniref:mitochondrial amidoxime-reducing component 1-like n=1 Tax=Bradysia coprophila TaxID=38358 RepID=UPI00187D9305|nr:mitochondrial amidoxime-reducing component 1-like [Bradysia coprophila]
MSDNQTKILISAAVAVGTLATATLAYLHAKKTNDPIPAKWKKVGEITDLNCFPVASCAPIKRKSFDCHKLGVQLESLFDRSFIVTRNDKQVIGQHCPNLVLIQPKVDGNNLILSAPGRSDFVLDLAKLRKESNRTKIDCKHTQVLGVDAGDPVGDWLSEHVGDEPGAIRLIFYPYNYPTKGVPERDRKYKDLKDEDVGTFHGKSSFMLINQKSIDELNSKLDQMVKPLQFRPNFLVQGPEAFDEDTWKWVRIGENVVFRVVRPCNRCLFITVNPDTGIGHPQNEPFKTLTKIRTIFKGDPPVMGIQLGLRIPGTVSIGDAVYINDESEV